ncbi:cupin domain-containing protein [Aurantimonas sp. Leaf443]|uniref:cupin domain-containing protein n=1 Tax=Aurantimonas sp. Leaf443 TaxID=1736378 RepID=UPI0006F390E2|nr:cupin domain-containing protein [Aurantimonas sp. Leaf443]KQT86329.1 cupin [Aurantimonas sp. Leaf443]
MSAHLLKFDTAGQAPEIGGPAPEKRVSGTPQHRTWNVEDDGEGLYSGIWESDVGEWAATYSEWEFCHILAGVAVLTEEGGEGVTVKAGDSIVIRRGFKGTWRIVEPLRKAYVIKD